MLAGAVDTPAIEASRTAATCSTEPLNPDTTHYMPGIAHFTPSIHKVVLLSMDFNTLTERPSFSLFQCLLYGLLYYAWFKLADELL